MSETTLKLLELIKEGKKVYDFSVGTPDFVPEKNLIKHLNKYLII